MTRPILHLHSTSPSCHIIYAHARHAHTTQHPSPTAKPAGLWSTRTSSQTPPHVPHDSTQPPTNSGASHKVSQTSGSNPPIRCSLFHSLRSPSTNDLPMPVLSAATIPKRLNLTAHDSQLAATSSITPAISA